MICPGYNICIIPPHIHIHLELFVRAGIEFINTSGFPGSQGIVVAGIHATGVNTPDFAAVAAATAGLDMVLHIPKDIMLSIGT